MMKKLWCVLLVLGLLILTGCSLQGENAGEESSTASKQETSGNAEDALARSYVRRKTTVKFEDTDCYVYKVVDDYGSHKKVTATYAASADGSIVLRYDIVTDEYVPISGE